MLTGLQAYSGDFMSSLHTDWYLPFHTIELEQDPSHFERWLTDNNLPVGILFAWEEPLTYRVGTCHRSDCQFAHNPNKTAACKSYLHKGHCPAGTACDLSHDLTPERIPLCQYFASNNCTNRHCQYAHIAYKDDAIVCDGFARLGYCEAGAGCLNKHVFECPDFSKGKCDAKRCFLPHVQRAGQLRARSSASADPTSNDHSEAGRNVEPKTEDVQVGFYEDVKGDSASPVAKGETSFQGQDDFIRL